MVTGGRAYVVREAGPGTDTGEVARVYPYTLDGLRQALDEARLRSYGGRPQLLAVLAGEESRVIRRYEHGREVPVTPLPPAAADHLAGRAPRDVLKFHSRRLYRGAPRDQRPDGGAHWCHG